MLNDLFDEDELLESPRPVTSWTITGPDPITVPINVVVHSQEEMLQGESGLLLAVCEAVMSDQADGPMRTVSICDLRRYLKRNPQPINFGTVIELPRYTRKPTGFINEANPCEETESEDYYDYSDLPKLEEVKLDNIIRISRES